MEKSKTNTPIAEITFNWERIKKQASKRKGELVSNAPQVVKRTTNSPPVDPVQSSSPMNTTSANQSPKPIRGHTRTTDSIIEPEIYRTDTDRNDMKDNGTQDNLLLPRTAAQEKSLPAVCGEETLGPETNAVALLQGIKEKRIVGKDLTVDERRLVVRSMKELGQTQDAIADLLKVSRRTIVSDYKVLRQEQALAIQSTDTAEIAGEVYATAKTLMRRAMQAGSFKTVSVIMRDMVEVLQSLGVVYRAPKTSMQAQLHGKIAGQPAGFNRYMETIGDDKNKVIDALDCMFNAIETDNI